MAVKFIDWVDIYLLLIEAGISDPLFSMLNIRRIPLKFIQHLTQKATVMVKNRRNAESISVANLGVLMYQIGRSFSGNTNSKQDTITLKSFIPHPELWEEDKKALSAKAQRIIEYLLANDSIKTKLANIVHLK